MQDSQDSQLPRGPTRCERQPHTRDVQIVAVKHAESRQTSHEPAKDVWVEESRFLSLRKQTDYKAVDPKVFMNMSEKPEEKKEEEKKKTKKRVLTLAKIRAELEKHRKRNIEEGDLKDAGRLARILDLLARCD